MMTRPKTPATTAMTACRDGAVARSPPTAARPSRSSTAAMATTARPVAMPRPVRRWLRVSMTSWPSPPAPSSVASTTIPNAIMIVWVTPAMIVGSAIGSCTLRRVCERVAPNIVDASTDCSATPRMPRVVNRTTAGARRSPWPAWPGRRRCRRTSPSARSRPALGWSAWRPAPVGWRCPLSDAEPPVSRGDADDHRKDHRHGHEGQRLNGHLPKPDQARVDHGQRSCGSRLPGSGAGDKQEDGDGDHEPGIQSRACSIRRARSAPVRPAGGEHDKEPVGAAVLLGPAGEPVKRIGEGGVEGHRHFDAP